MNDSNGYCPPTSTSSSKSDPPISHDYSGVEHHLLGLAPQYWAYTPMLVRDFLSLRLENGVDCLHSPQPRSAHPQKKRRLAPVSRCELVGSVVNLERRSNGSVLYLLDDGTGTVDCVSWEEEDGHGYRLPRLKTGTAPASRRRVRLGDTVRVFGKIRCLSGIHAVVREVNVTSISSMGGNGSCESLHWLNCLKLHKRLSSPSRTNEGQTAESTITTKPPVNPRRANGGDILRLLGPDISSKLTAFAGAVDEDDFSRAWQVFGHGCPCDRLGYKPVLLYCHCNATSEGLDPHFYFRDALLLALVNMERDCRLEPETPPRPFHFHYGDAIRIPSVKAAAEKTAKGDVVNERRIFVNTFRALREDGVIHLADEETDEYALISRERAIRPYCERIMKNGNTKERGSRRSRPPAHIENVPRARLRYVMKEIAREKKGSGV